MRQHSPVITTLKQIMVTCVGYLVLTPFVWKLATSVFFDLLFSILHHVFSNIHQPRVCGHSIVQRQLHYKHLNASKNPIDISHKPLTMLRDSQFDQFWGLLGHKYLTFNSLVEIRTTALETMMLFRETYCASKFQGLIRHISMGRN